MKVVLFCGGLGMRIRDAEGVPKPMVTIGSRPVLWHLMKYYAHYGHKDFILCLGYRGDAIKQFFLDYNECVSNDFVLSEGGRKLELASSDISDWRITFVDTGLNSNIGQRLKAVQPYLEGETTFLANYADGLTDLPLPAQLAHFQSHDALASFVCVRPPLTYHMVDAGDQGVVRGIRDMEAANVRVNGGFFILRQEIFDYLHEGEELVVEPFQRLIADSRLVAYTYDGFWMPMDTFKDRTRLEEMHTASRAPWQIWRTAAPRVGATTAINGGASTTRTVVRKPSGLAVATGGVG
jgi:glucose-1-phosphate cytidylyltransferase